MTIDQKTVDELKAKHGELHQLSSDGFTVVVRKPDRPNWRAFIDSSFDARRRVDAIERLFLSCVVWPEATAVSAMLDAKPGLAQDFGSEVVDLAKDGEIEKKAL